MSITTEKFQYRCDGCWSEFVADISQAGCETICPNCEKPITIPAATPERLNMARDLSLKDAEGDAPEDWSDEAIQNYLSKKHNYVEDASLVGRFAAKFIDFIVAAVSGLVSILVIFVCASTGLAESLGIINDNFAMQHFAFLVFLFIVSFGQFFQWGLLARDGQTIGKKVMSIRIVSSDGKSKTGFFQNVVLREWVNTLLGLLPGYGLLDPVFALTSSHRCLHDYVAGTRVISHV